MARTAQRGKRLNQMKTDPDQRPDSEICINLPEEMANGVVHPVTKETLTKYHKIIEVPELKEAWMTGMYIKLGRLA